MSTKTRLRIRRSPGPFISATTHEPLQLGQDISEGSHDKSRGSTLQNEKDPSRSRDSTLWDAPKESLGDRGKRKASEPLPSSRSLRRPPEPDVTLGDLVRAGMLKPGNRRLSVRAGSETVVAGLLSNGTISHAGNLFETVFSFASHVAKRTGCEHLAITSDKAWDSVRYDGRPLSSLRFKFLKNRGYRKGPEPEAEDDAVEGNWIQCDACQTWRIVPDEAWQKMDVDNIESWFCHDAFWNVMDEIPYTKPCRRRRLARQESP
mmetsp:Transcript_4159/g.10021  ORF Transcript_4159/g.10021 Transcript_4159/m.10021 type:complete len:262 (-) Transcript_4159:374-1159(-)